MSLGGILFIGLGGVLADIGWRVPFLIYLFALLVLPMAVMFLREPETAQRGSGTAGIKAPTITYLLFFNTMFMWIIFFLLPVQIPFHMKAIGVEKNSLVGAAIAMSTLFSAISSISYAKLKDRFNFITIYVIGYFLMSGAFAIISMSKSYEVAVAGMMLSGLGIGMMIPNTNMWIMKIVPPEIRGKEIGKLTTFWFFGQFISPIVIFPLLRVLNLAETFMVAAVLLLLVSLLFLIFYFSKTGQEATK